MKQCAHLAGVAVYLSPFQSQIHSPGPRLIPDRLKEQLREKWGLSVLWKVSVGSGQHFRGTSALGSGRKGRDRFLKQQSLTSNTRICHEATAAPSFSHNFGVLIFCIPSFLFQLSEEADHSASIFYYKVHGHQVISGDMKVTDAVSLGYLAYRTQRPPGR